MVMVVEIWRRRLGHRNLNGMVGDYLRSTEVRGPKLGRIPNVFFFQFIFCLATFLF